MKKSKVIPVLAALVGLGAVGGLFALSHSTTSAQKSAAAIGHPAPGKQADAHPETVPDGKDGIDDIPAWLQTTAHTLTREKLRELQNVVVERQTASEDEQRHAASAEVHRNFGYALMSEADAAFDDTIRPTATAHRESCASGDQNACALLGQMYEKGEGSPTDPPLSTALYFIACKSGDDLGCDQFYGTSHTRTSSPGTPEIAHFKKRCEEGLASACRNIGSILTYGYGGAVEEDAERGAAYTARACELGIKTACTSHAYLKQTPEQNLAECEAGVARACAFAAGKIGDRNALLTRGCTLGSASACYQSARQYTKGEGQDDERALDFFEKACALSHSMSCKFAGEWRETGRGSQKDPVKALAHYQKACDPRSAHTCKPYWRLNAETFQPLEAAADALFASDLRGKARKAREGCHRKTASDCIDLADIYREEEAGERKAIAPLILMRACDLGDYESCTKAGTALRDHRSAALHERACNAGFADGCVAFAMQTSIDPQTRLAALEKNCADGGGASCLVLASRVGRMRNQQYERIGLNPPKDVDLALSLLERSCTLGHGDGCTYLARSMDGQSGNDNWDNAPQDIARALVLYNRGCDLGSAWGCSQVSYQYETGDIGTRDLTRAYDLAKRACDLSEGYCDDAEGRRMALERQALNEEHGILGAALQERYDEFLPHFLGSARRARAACKRGDMQGCTTLGDLYGTSDYGGPVGVYGSDREWTVALYKHACEGDLASACYGYASLHNNAGDNTDPAIANPAYRRACDLGHGDACSELGTDYEHGWDDLPKDAALSHEYRIKGCANGSDYACSELSDVMACVYGKGYRCSRVAEAIKSGEDGIRKDRDLADDLYRLGCEHGEEGACAKLNR